MLDDFSASIVGFVVGATVVTLIYLRSVYREQQRLRREVLRNREIFRIYVKSNEDERQTTINIENNVDTDNC